MTKIQKELNKIISEKTEPLMNAAILEMIRSDKLDPLVTQTQQMKDMWQKRMKMFNREGETLFFLGGGGQGCAYHQEDGKYNFATTL